MKTQLNKYLALIENKDTIINQAIAGKLPDQTAWQLLVVSGVSVALFGCIIGGGHSFAQGLISAVKLPLIFLFTGVICYPTLYLFLSLLGLGYSFKRLAHFLILCVAINSFVLIAFAPVSVFFLITNTEYELFKMLNVGLMAIGGFSGIYIFKKYLFIQSPENWEEKYAHRSRMFVNAWLIMYGMIGANMGFFLSPVFGNPDEPIIFITESSENFFSHVVAILLGS